MYKARIIVVSTDKLRVLRSRPFSTLEEAKRRLLQAIRRIDGRRAYIADVMHYTHN